MKADRSKTDVHANECRPQLEELEPRLLLSLAVQNVLPTAPLRPLVDQLYNQLKDAIPPDFREAVMPIIDLAMQSGRAGYSYLGFPGEVNDIRIWGELGNTLLLTDESKDVTVFRLGTLSFQPIEKIDFKPGLKVEGGGSFVAHIAAGLGLQLDGICSSLLKGWFDLSKPRVVALNGTTLVNLLPSAKDLLNAFDYFMNFSLSDIIPNEVTVIPPIYFLGSKIWEGWKIPIPSELQNLPTVGDLIAWTLPKPVRDVFDGVQDVLTWLQSTFVTDGVYVSALDGPDKIDLSNLTGIPQTVHGGSGNDLILGGGGEDLLNSWGFPFRGERASREVELFGDDGNDTFIINRRFDSTNTTIDGGPGSDVLVIQGSDASEIIRLIAGPDGTLQEIRFEIPNPLAGVPANEKQRLTMPGDVYGGTFRLKAEGWGWTADLDWDATASEIEDELVAIAGVADPTLGYDDIEVTGGGTWEVEFMNSLAGKNFTPLVVDGSKLQRRVTAAAVLTDREGGDGGGQPIANEIQEIGLPAGVTGGTFTLQFDTYPETGPIPAQGGIGDLELALLRTGLARQDFEVTGGYGGPWRIEFTGNLALTDVPEIVVDASGLWGALDNWELARTRPGVEGTNYTQLIAVPPEANGGTYKVTVKVGSSSRPTDVAYNATAVELEQAIESLGTVGSGNVQVTRQLDGRFRVEFVNDLAGDSQVVMSIDARNLQGLEVTETQQGTGSDNEIQEVSLPGTPQGGHFRLSFGGELTDPIPTSATGADIDAALESLSTIGSDNVNVTGPAGGPWQVEFVNDKANTDVAMLGAEFVIGTQQEATGSDGENEIQTLQIPAGVTGGHLQLIVRTPKGSAGTVVEYDPDNTDHQDLQDALEALSVVGEGNVQVTGSGRTFEITFIDELGFTPIDPIIVDTRFLAGGGTATVKEFSSLTVNEIQKVQIPYEDAASGTFRLELPGHGTTDPIDFNASVEEFKDALEAAFGVGNVEVTGESRAWEIEFTGALGGQDLPEMTVVDGQAEVRGAEIEVEELTAGNNGENTTVLATTRFTQGGSLDDLKVTEIQKGTATANEIQEISVVAGLPGNAQFRLRFDGELSDPIPTSATGADVGAVLESLSTVGLDNVNVTGTAGGPWQVEFVNGKANTDVPMLGAEFVGGLKNVELFEIAGGGGNDTLIIDNSQGPIHFADGIYFNGGTGLNRIIFTSDGTTRASSGEHKGGGSTMTFGVNPEDFQLVTYASSAIYDFVPADELRVRGSSEADTIELTQDEYEGEPVGLIRISNGPSRLYYLNKDNLVVQARFGDDLITLHAGDLPAGVQSLTIDGESSTAGDQLLINGTDQDDVFEFTPTSMKGGTLTMNIGGRDVMVDLAGIESFGIDGRGQDVTADTLIVNAVEATIEPGDFPGTGEVTPRSAAGLARLPVEYVNMENVELQALSVLAFDGSVGDDVVEVTPAQVIFTDIFGHDNITDVAGADVVWLHLMDGNDDVTVSASAPLPFQLEILAGGSDPGGDLLGFTGAGSQVALDLSDQSLTEASGSRVTFSGVECFNVNTAGAALAISTDDDDETVSVTPLDSNAGRLAITGSPLMVRYAGLAGQAVAVDLASGQDTLVVNGSADDDILRLDAAELTFTDDGRRVAYAGAEALTVNALQGNDQLDVDNSAGLVDLPGGIYYGGGLGHDVLRLLGPTTVDQATYDGGPDPSAGIVTHLLGSERQLVSFANVESAIDLVGGALTVNGTGVSDVINGDVGPNSGTPLAMGLTTALICVDAYAALEFGGKMVLVILGSAGHDTIDLNGIAMPPTLEAIILDGGAGDDQIIGSAAADQLLGGRGNDLLRGEGGDDVLAGGFGADTLLGGDGDDLLNWDHGADFLDGGAGDDTAAFVGSDASDAVQMTAEEVTFNGVTSGLANVETVTLGTFGGDDVIGIDAGENFPAQLNVAGGTGDDQIDVLLANPAPPTTINVDGGPHVLGDTATVKGRTGEDQFIDYGELNTFGAAVVNLTNIENSLILEGRRIDSDRTTTQPNRFLFGDDDGNVTTVRITGPGSVDVFRNIVNGRYADIHALELIGTNELQTGVSVNVRKAAGTDNETPIGAITGDGAKTISAPRSDLVGEGINVTGGVRKLVLDDILDGANLSFGGRSGQYLSVRADQVGDVNLVTGRLLRSLKVSSWTGGSVQASVLDRVAVTQGPFGADLVNTLQNKADYGIKDVSVKGDLTTNITADRVRSIRVAGGNATVNVLTTTDAATLFGRSAVETFSVKGGDVLGADFNIPAGTLLKRFDVRSAKGVGGNVTGAVNITGDLGNTYIAGDLVVSEWNVAGQMGDFVVKGAARAEGALAAVRSGGDMGAIRLGAVEHVDFLAGMDIDPPARTPDSAGDFANTARIESITIVGQKTPKGAPIPRFMTDCYFSAASMGVVKMRNADATNTGLYVLDNGGDELGSVRYRDSADSSMNFNYPPRGGQVFSQPFPLINVI